MSDLYGKLANHLDDLPGGYPKTESGVEMRILKRLFAPEEAELAVCLTMIPEEASAIAERTGREKTFLALVLAEMARKGLIFHSAKGGKDLYSAAMFIIGIWEYHLNDLDEDLVKDVNEYLPYFSRETWLKHNTKHLRVVPISKEIAAEAMIASYEDAEEIIKKQSKIVVQPCICRKEHDFVGEACAFPMEVCLSFGTAAYYYEENNLGRAIGTEEALGILHSGRKSGLVIQPGNAQKPTNLCMCCGCCCQILKNMKAVEKPARIVHSNYYAQVDQENCTACEACSERCHMDAIEVADVAHVNPDRCIGCGVCVPECPTDAMMYLKKESTEMYVPPRNVFETYMKMAKERGKL